MVWEQNSNQTLQFLDLLCHVLVGTWKCEVVLLRQGLVFSGGLPKQSLGFWDCWALGNNKQERIEWNQLNYANLCEIMHILNMSWKLLVKLLMMFLNLEKKESWLAWSLWTPCFLKNKFEPTNDWLDPTTMAPRTLIKNMPRATGIGPGKEKSDWDSKSNFTCFGKILSWVCMFSLGQSLHSRGNG